MHATARRSASRPDASAFARLLRERRLASALTQEELAQRLRNVTARTIGDWERDISHPGPRHYKALADFMQLSGPGSVMDLIEGDGCARPFESATVLTLHPGTSQTEAAAPSSLFDGIVILNEFWKRRLLGDRDRAPELAEREWESLDAYTSMLERLAERPTLH